MIGPGVAERDVAAAACRNAEVELQEIAARLSAASAQLTGEVPLAAAVGFTQAQDCLLRARAALEQAAAELYRGA